MSSSLFRVTLVFALTASANISLAQSNISPVNKQLWSENCGWMDWHDAGSPAGAQGARLLPSVLSGFIWSENVGYINLGDGSPVNGAAYTNFTGNDFGVNIDTQTGNLSGLAWGENAGWINFAGGASAGGAAVAARYDVASKRLRGYAWGENIGWINLDDSAHYVSIGGCPCDWNNSGLVTVQDVFDFLTSYFSNAADFNGADGTSVQDIFDFLSCFFVGCN